MSSQPPSSTPAHLTIQEGHCVLTYDVLDVQAIISSVADHSVGATAVFVGTTRNSFQGKVVTKLEYQAYSKLAISTMADIVRNATHQTHHASRSDHEPTTMSVSPTIRCAVHHRLGAVAVGESSIVIAVSSPHRIEAFQACQMILEDVKSRAQIWKREFYEGDGEESATWKSNHSI